MLLIKGAAYCDLVVNLLRFFHIKELRAVRGKFGPLWRKKLKVAFHQFHPISLLEEWPKCKILAFILPLPLLW